MSLARVLPHLEALCVDAESEGTVWQVLFARRPKPLFVAAEAGAEAGRALDFFIENPLLRCLGRLQLRHGRWLPHAWRAPTVRIAGVPPAAIGAASAAYCGTPGPLQKLTLLCAGDDEGVVVKLALRASADRAVAAEAACLRLLGAVASLAPSLPRLLDEGMLPGGRRFVAMSALPAGRRSTRFAAPHRSFLAALASRRTTGPWAESGAFARLRAQVDGAQALVDRHWGALLRETLAEIEAALGERNLPACQIHGDFAPWNLRLSGGRLLAFDWEYAHASGNPLQDFLHFHCIERVTRRRWGGHRIGTKAMRRLLAAAAFHADGVFGADSGVAAVAGPLAAHYLLDTITFYVGESGALDPRHPVLRGYLLLLEQRRQWLGGPTSGWLVTEDRQWPTTRPFSKI